MGKNLEQQILWIFNDKYGQKWNPEILKDIRRLKAGEPIDYIIGWKPFLNCKIDLSYKPLIPRPETEFWVEKAIEEIKASKKPAYVADVFSGSGCIGISILKNIKNAKVDFFEIDSSLIKQIKINLKINKIKKSRYRVIESDILEKSRKKYDFILANPPYIATTRKNKIQKEVLKYEPKKALFGGKDGLNLIKKFLNQAQNHLNIRGQIWMEFDSFQKPLIQELLKKSGYKEWEFYKDQYGKWRCAILKLF